MSNIDFIIQQACAQFTDYVFTHSWWGKEREAVSLFAFGYLIKQCRPGSILYDPAQIGIEVRVPKAENRGSKREICKDLVIWSGPGATCWDKNQWPMAILEWKAHKDQGYAEDIAWLAAFSYGRPEFTGYAICLDLKQRNFRLSCTRIQDKKVYPEWLVL